MQPFFKKPRSFYSRRLRGSQGIQLGHASGYKHLMDSRIMQKKAYKPFNGFVLLVNDTQTGKVRAGTYQSVIEGGENTFVAVGPFHGHSVTRDGRRCADCHDNDRIAELNDTGFIVIAHRDDMADPPGIVHTTGAVPFYPSVMEFEFVDYDAGGDVWTAVGTALDQMQWEFCEPLTLDQMTALGMD